MNSDRENRTRNSRSEEQKTRVSSPEPGHRSPEEPALRPDGCRMDLAPLNSPGSRSIAVESMNILDKATQGKGKLQHLADELAYSPGYIQKVFQRHWGMTPAYYIRKRKAEQFRRNLAGGDSILDATYNAGYSSLREPYETFKHRQGMSPGSYRKAARGLMIQYDIFPSELGHVLIGRSPMGICALYLGDAPDSLESEIRSEFSNAEILRKTDPDRTTIEDYIAGKSQTASLTLHLIGTEFQKQVWTALASIPYGETRSYGEIARSLGKPGAARAVGRACGSNRIALLIPCHRVVGQDGSIGGYRWNPSRKAMLLQREQRRQ